MQENETSIVGDDACDIPNPFHSTSPTREANEAYCRGGACSSRDPSDICHQTAEQMKPIVGEGLAPAVTYPLFVTQMRSKSMLS